MAQDAFDRFVAQRMKDLKRIASHSEREYQLADVVNEAWIMARDLASNPPFDFLDTASQDLLLSHLYQHLVRYTELHIRRAVRLDHAPAGTERDDDSHPLMAVLAVEEIYEPLTQLIGQENSWHREMELRADGSLASAYVHLLRLFDNKMQAVADHLLISRSHAYRCCAHARLLAMRQRPVPEVAQGGKFVPGPWRRFQLRRTPIQLAFDFGNEPSLEGINVS